MAELKRSPAIQTALIGLIGSMLTVIGGLCGATVASITTIYELERQNQHIALAAPTGGQSLSIDTGSIFISRQDGAALDPSTYYVDFEHGFVLHRPISGWDALEEITVEEQLAEDNATCRAVCDQPVFRIRYGEPIEIESDRQTMVNGQPIPGNLLDLSEQLYGPPPWKGSYYSQVIVNVFEKDAVQALGIRNLPDMILLMMRFYSGRVNRMISPEGSQFAIIQGSTTYDGIRVDGNPATMTIDNWLLFAEAKSAFYAVEIKYTVQSRQPLLVWDDLQTYMEYFRVIE
jgi:hypothetical protein